MRIVISKCVNCVDHQDSTRHVEARYVFEFQKAHSLLTQFLGSELESIEVLPKMGGFEVMLCREGFPPTLLFSKLRCGRFPREGEIKSALEKVLQVQPRHITSGLPPKRPPTGQQQQSQPQPQPRKPDSQSADSVKHRKHVHAHRQHKRPATAGAVSDSRTKERDAIMDTVAAKIFSSSSASSVTTTTTDEVDDDDDDDDASEVVVAARVVLQRPSTGRSGNSIGIDSSCVVHVNELVELAANRQWLRKLFVETAMKYIGVPYLKPPMGAPSHPHFHPGFHLDCCGLVRQCVKDLRKHFGFMLRGWNQGYQFDTLPMALSKHEEMMPGDLVFISGTYHNAEKRKKKNPAHSMVHVEIFLGGATGEQTIGARQRYGAVEIHDSYRFVSKNYHSMVYHFRSIDTWLAGECKSWCSEHRWRCG